MKKIILGMFGNKEDEINYTHVLYEKKEYLYSEKKLNDIELELKRCEGRYYTAQQEIEKLKSIIKRLEKKNELDNQILSQTVNGQIAANERVKELEKLNERLYEINRETINSKRGIKPKKEHSGYMIKGIFEKEFKIYSEKYDFWVYKLQTPYSVFLEKKEIRPRILDDLKNYLGKDLGLKSKENIFYDVSNLKEFIEIELEKQEISYSSQEALNLFHDTFITSNRDLLVDFKLTAHNGEYWDIQFFSKEQLKLDLSLMKK